MTVSPFALLQLLDLQIRLSEIVEACVNGMDSTFTSGLSKESFVRLVWVLTRQRPTVSLSSLRVEYYTQLNTKLRARHESLLALADSGMKDCVEALLKQSELTDLIISSLCEELQFDEEWMTVKLGKAGKASAKAKAVEGTRPLLLSTTKAQGPPPVAPSVAKQPGPVPVPKTASVAAVPTQPVTVAKALMQAVPKMSVPMQAVPKQVVKAALPKQPVNPASLPKQTVNPASLPKQTVHPASLPKQTVQQPALPMPKQTVQHPALPMPKQTVHPALPKQAVNPTLPKQSMPQQQPPLEHREGHQEPASWY